MELDVSAFLKVYVGEITEVVLAASVAVFLTAHG